MTTWPAPFSALPAAVQSDVNDRFQSQLDTLKDDPESAGDDLGQKTALNLRDILEDIEASAESAIETNRVGETDDDMKRAKSELRAVRKALKALNAALAA